MLNVTSIPILRAKNTLEEKQFLRVKKNFNQYHNTHSR